MVYVTGQYPLMDCPNCAKRQTIDHLSTELRLVQEKNKRLRDELEAMNRATRGSVEARLRDEIRIYRKGLSFVVDSPDAVRLDRLQLRQVAANILRDADEHRKGQG